jgi:hypothetical protein
LVKDEGESKRLSIINFRCFRALSGDRHRLQNAKITNVKIDRVIPAHQHQNCPGS